jgi:uncharacterized membrane protein (DUF485 family)
LTAQRKEAGCRIKSGMTGEGMKDWRQIAADPRYRALVRRRGRLAWALTALMLAAYFGFILAVAFARPLLARPVGGGVTTLGVIVAVGVILLGFALTAVYVRVANRRFDAAARELIEPGE